MGAPQHSPDLLRVQGQATFVLVHGAWHGGWCWKRVADRLRAMGYAVHTPTLTGLGERAHLLAPDIDLTTHVEDVLGVLEYEDLSNVVLVGHSYGGMVISGVAARSSSRVSTLVYLDAFLPEPDRSLRDYMSVADEEWDAIVHTLGDGWRFPSPWRAQDFGITDENDATWVNRRLGDQPYRTFTQPVTFPADLYRTVKGAYILTNPGGFDAHAERAKALGFDYFEVLEGGHDAMVTQPAALVEVLLTIADHHPAPTPPR